MLSSATLGFFDVSLVSGTYFSESLVGRGAAYADYDNDGDLDVLVVNNIGPAKLLRNDGGNSQNWIQLTIKQQNNNSFAIGSKIRIVGEKDQVDTVEISWVNAGKKIITQLEANQILTITEEK